MQVIGAHSADFVWRAGGAVAGRDPRRRRGRGDRALLRRARRVGRAVEGGGPDDRERQADPPRRGRSAAAALGATFRCLDLGDYPLEIDGDALLRDRRRDPRVRARRADHPHRHRPVQPRPPGRLRRRRPRARAGRRRGRAERVRARSRRRTLFLFEPHQPELCNFTPTTFVDITSVCEHKLAAMAEMKAQQYLQTYYAQRAEQRGNHARRASGDAGRPLRRGVPARAPAGGDGAVSDARRARPPRRPRPSTRPPAGEGLVDARAPPGRPRLARRGPGPDRCAAARTTT